MCICLTGQSSTFKNFLLFKVFKYYLLNRRESLVSCKKSKRERGRARKKGKERQRQEEFQFYFQVSIKRIFHFPHSEKIVKIYQNILRAIVCLNIFEEKTNLCFLEKIK